MVVQATGNDGGRGIRIVVKGHRNGGSSNQYGLGESVSNVVKGHRNGGSSNSLASHTARGMSCERPPKWWFKQHGTHRLRVRHVL